MKATRLTTGLLGLVLLTGLGGCGSSPPELPSIDPTARQSYDPARAVPAFYDCMKRPEIPLGLVPADGAHPPQIVGLVDLSADQIVVTRDPDGTVDRWGGKEGDDSYLDLVDELTAEHSTEPRFYVNGVDYSDLYQKCLASSGYDPAWGHDDETAVDPAWVRRRVEADNRWAACARDQGWPQVADVAAPADGSLPPEVLLPFSITEDQLRQLVADCPTFDPALFEAGAAFGDASADLPEIGFDTTGADEFDSAAADKLGRLLDILNAAQSDYWAGQGG